MTSVGIRHVHLLVHDPERSAAFYADVFGMTELFRSGPILFIGTPDGGDNLALHRAETDDERARVGDFGGCEHFGIHLPDRSAESIDAAVARVEAAGGSLVDRGVHGGDSPYAYVRDLDGYTIEL